MLAGQIGLYPATMALLEGAAEQVWKVRGSLIGDICVKAAMSMRSVQRILAVYRSNCSKALSSLCFVTSPDHYAIVRLPTLACSLKFAGQANVCGGQVRQRGTWRP